MDFSKESSPAMIRQLLPLLRSLSYVNRTSYQIRCHHRLAPKVSQDLNRSRDIQLCTRSLSSDKSVRVTFIDRDGDDFETQAKIGKTFANIPRT